MPTFATFQRLKDKGLAAYKRGDYAAARPYLIQAAECMLDIAAASKDEKIRQQQESYARELIELAKECQKRAASATGRQPGRDRAREDDDRGPDVSEWIVRDKPDVSFDDIAGLEDAKQEIYLRMIYPFRKPELARQYGIPLGGGLLLYGPPGTGKTMIAKAIANELDATMFVLSPAQIMSKWVGEAEQNVRRLFEAARAEPKAVIFLDEIEALVPKRRGQQSTVMQRVVPQILQELEGFSRKGDRALLFLGATNEPWAIDPAMMRPGRFDTKVYVPLPDAAARFRLFEIHLASRPLADDVDFAKLVELTEGYSGADIRAIAQRSAIGPFLESVKGEQPRPITMKDILAAIEATPPSVSPKDVERFERWRASEGL